MRQKQAIRIHGWMRGSTRGRSLVRGVSWTLLMVPLLALAAPPHVTPSQPAPDNADVRAAVARLVPGAAVEQISASPLPGFSEVVIEGQVVYVSDDGRYLLEGNLLDTNTRANLTETARADVRREDLAHIPASERIAFAPDKTTRRVTVYTDFDCGVCRRLHDQMADYNKLGIAVDYLLFPRAGIGSPSYAKAVSVWCATDRAQALTQAMRGTDPSPLQCDNPVDEHVAAGTRMKFHGTPALYAADGTYLGGYLAPAQLLAKLDAVAAAGGD